MKIYVMTDLEGAAGVVDFEGQAFDTGRYYEKARELLTQELNAAARGAIAAGANDILAVDGHGAGGIVYENLIREVRLLHGRPVPKMWGMDMDRWDAMFLLAHHAMNGTCEGNLNHSYDSRSVVSISLNGKPIGEIGMNIYLAGWHDIPCTLITGDEAACNEAQIYVPAIEKAVVKYGLNRTCAISLSPEKARETIQEAAHKAAKKAKDVKPLKIKGKCELVIEYISSALAFAHANKPFAESVDGRRIRIQGRNFMDMWSKWHGS